MSEPEEKSNQAFAKAYERAGLRCCAIPPKGYQMGGGQQYNGKRPMGREWNAPEKVMRTARKLTQTLESGFGLGCVHAFSGTGVVDFDAPVELVRRAFESVGVDLDAVLNAATPTSVGNPEREPKRWFRVPEGVELDAKKLVWKDCLAGGGELVDITVFELRAGLVQDILPPTMHPDAGTPYAWTGAPPAGPEDFAPVPDELLRLWTNWEELLPAMEAAKPGAQPAATAPKPEPPPSPARKAPVPAEQPRTGEDWTPADWCAAWNANVTVQNLLVRYGYKRANDGMGKPEVARFLSPGSKSGEPGVAVMLGTGGIERAYSWHGDAIAAARANDKAKALDAWGIFKLLGHGGSTLDAIKAAREELRAMGVWVPGPSRPTIDFGVRIDGPRRRYTKEKKPEPAASGATQPQSVANLAVEFAPDPVPDVAPNMEATAARDSSQDGLALALADIWNGTVRHTVSQGWWHVWNGHVWEADESGRVPQTALEFLRARAVELKAAAAVKIKDEDELARKRRMAAAVKEGDKLKSRRTLQDVLALAGLQKRQAIVAEDWDRHEMLLATPGGTVNLETGELLPGNPDWLLTQCTAVTPAPEGSRPETFLAALHYSMGGEKDPERAASLVAYLRRFFGYCLTGLVREHVIVFGYGSGRNGKTLLVEAVANAMGSYAGRFPANALMASTYEAIPDEIAALRGKRLAVASETRAGSRWDSERMKKYTGGEKFTVRRLYERSFVMNPQFKMFMVGNHKPNLRDVDLAMKRRVQMVPFTVTVPEGKVDVDLPAKIAAESPQILRWMIDGCLEYLEGGLRPPDAVLEATRDYFDEQDIVGDFVKHCLVLDDPNARETADAVWMRWQDWTRLDGRPERSKDWLSKKLVGLGIQRIRTAHARFFVGVQLKP